MLKAEFINKLSHLINKLSEQERDKAISYYEELIDDKIEAGEAEEQVILDFGDINELANNILAENNPVQETQKRQRTGVQTALFWALSPFIFTFGLIGIILLFSAVIVLFSLTFALFAAAAALLLGGVIVFLVAFIVLMPTPLWGIMQMGGGMLMAGIGLIFGMTAFYLAKAVGAFTHYSINLIKIAFSKIK